MHLLIVMLFIKQKQKKKYLKFIQCLPPILKGNRKSTH